MNIALRSGSLFARCFGFVVLVMASGYAKLNAQQTTLRGQATNESMRPWVTAEIQFTLTANGDGKGNLTVRPPLYGSGVAHALFRRDTLVITTTDAGGGTIVWIGNIRGDSVVGRYRILTKRNAGQEGNWAAVRTSGPPLLNRSGQVGALNADEAESERSLMRKLRVSNLETYEMEVILSRLVFVWPDGPDSLASFLTAEVIAAIATAGPNQSSTIPYGEVPGNGTITPDRAALFILQLCAHLSSWQRSPSVAVTASLQRAIKDLDRYKPGSAEVRRMQSVLDLWEERAKPAQAPTTDSSSCSSTTNKPSTPCLLGWIEGFTQTGGKLWQLCLNHVAGLAAEGYVPNMGGRSDQEDQQLGIRYCVEGSAFIAYVRWHPQLQRDAPRTFTRLEKAYGIASRARLLVVR